MRWLWVSRARFDFLVQQLEKSEKERSALLHELLARQDGPEKPTKDADEKKPVMNFSNPFDGVLNRFDQARVNGKIPDRFRARLF